MDKQRLRQQLQTLHDELQQVGSLDDSEREMLQNLSADVQEVLQRDDDDRAHSYSSLGARLREVVAQVEASHPRVTILMREVIDQLSFMGI